MPEDLDENIEDILVEDDASVYKDGLSIEERQALYHPNGLVDGPTGLTDQEREAAENIMSPDRTGFAEALKGVLK